MTNEEYEQSDLRPEYDLKTLKPTNRTRQLPQIKTPQGVRKLGALNPLHERRMSSHQIRVTEMIDKIRTLGGLAATPSKPTVPERNMIEAQAKLILEEFMEVLEACGIDLLHRASDRVPPSHQLTAKNLVLSSNDKPVNIGDVAKELADLSVVTTGMFVEFGMSDMPILEEVDDNNLEKFGPGGYLDENRKWRKPPNHPKPDMLRVLRRQGFGMTEADNEENLENTTVPSGHDQQVQEPVSVSG